jgi:hypothetical protein
MAGSQMVVTKAKRDRMRETEDRERESRRNVGPNIPSKGMPPMP